MLADVALEERHSLPPLRNPLILARPERLATPQRAPGVEGSSPSEPRAEPKPEAVTAVRSYRGAEGVSAVENPEKPKETGGVLLAKSSDINTENVGDEARDVSGQHEGLVAIPKEAKKPATWTEKPKHEPKLVQKQVAGLRSKVVGDKAQIKDKGNKPATAVISAKKAARRRAKQKPKPAAVEAEIAGVETGIVDDKTVEKDAEGDGPAKEKRPTATVTAAKKPARSRAKPGPKPAAVKAEVSGAETEIFGDKARDNDTEGDGPEEKKTPATTVATEKKQSGWKAKPNRKPTAVEAEVASLETGLISDQAADKDAERDGPEAAKTPAALATAAKTPVRSRAKPKRAAVQVEVSSLENRIVGDKAVDKDAEGDGTGGDNRRAETVTTATKSARSKGRPKPEPAVEETEVSDLETGIVSDKALEKDAKIGAADEENRLAATFTTTTKPQRLMVKPKQKPAAVGAEVAGLETGNVCDKVQDKDSEGEGPADENQCAATVTAARKPVRSRAKPKPKPAVVQAEIAGLAAVIVGQIEENRPAAAVTAARKPSGKAKRKLKQAVMEAKVGDLAIGILGDKARNNDAEGCLLAEENRPAAPVAAVKKPARRRAKPNLMAAVQSIANSGQPGETTAAGIKRHSPARELASGLITAVGSHENQVSADPSAVVHRSTTLGSPESGEDRQYNQSPNRRTVELRNDIPATPPYGDDELSQVTPPGTPIEGQGSAPSTQAVPSSPLFNTSESVAVPSNPAVGAPSNPADAEPSNTADAEPSDPPTRTASQDSPPSTQTIPSTTPRTTTAPVAEPPNLSARVASNDPPPSTQVTPWTTPSTTPAPIDEPSNLPANMASEDSPPSTQAVPSSTPSTTPAPAAGPPELPARMASEDAPPSTQAVPSNTASTALAPFAEPPNRSARMASHDSPPSTQAVTSTTPRTTSAPVAEPSSLPENLISLNRRLDNISAAAALFEEASRQLDFENVSQEDQDLMIEFVISDAMRDPQFARLFRSIVRVASDPDFWQGM